MRDPFADRPGFFSGGWPGNYGADDPDEAVVVPELYTPGIDWDNGDFSGEEGWVDLSAQPAPNRRGYHSTALLLPDGRVWHGGSTTTQDDPDGDGITGDGPNRNIDIFEPDYIGVAGRPNITSCPANIGYAMAPGRDTAGKLHRARRSYSLRCDYARL